MTTRDGEGGSDRSVPESGDADAARAFLRRLAGAADGRIIDRADAAVDDLEAAVAFVEAHDLADLERAVAAADDPERRARGERALAEFRRFRRAAAGDAPPDHFRRGHDTDLRDAGERTRQ